MIAAPAQDPLLLAPQAGLPAVATAAIIPGAAPS